MILNLQSDQFKIAVGVFEQELYTVAKAFADKLQLPLLPPVKSPLEAQQTSYQFLLTVTMNAACGYQLELYDLSQNNTKLFIDYSSGEIAYRARHGGGRKQALGKAVGLKPGFSPTVIDATAGLGRDAFILASLGCQVRMIERSPVMGCLVEDAIRRANFDARLSPWITQRLQLILGDARHEIPSQSSLSPADVIYIDPMYPARTKSALVKKEMRFIQALVGKDIDSAEVLTVALQYAKKRVVVKRPSSAAAITGLKPAHSITAKNTRFDVYMIQVKTVARCSAT